MKTDLYTKAVLTLIAVSLLWLCARLGLPSADAQIQPPVMNVRVVQSTTLPVHLENGIVAVGLAGTGTHHVPSSGGDPGYEQWDYSTPIPVTAMAVKKK